MTAPNRAQRRAWRRKAQGAAAELAAHCYDFGPTGGLVRVSRPLAVAALRRAFSILLRGGGAPVAVKLTPAEAAAFPRWRSSGDVREATWLAVGLDAEQRASYALECICMTHAGQDLSDAAARAAALMKLAGVTAANGFPIGAPRGRA